VHKPEGGEASSQPQIPVQLQEDQAEHKEESRQE